MAKSINQQSSWPTWGIVLTVGAFVAVLFFVIRGSARRQNITTGDHSPQFIGGDNTTFNISQQLGHQVADDIKETFQRLKLLPAQLTQRYPYGWVLFNQSPGSTSFHFRALNFAATQNGKKRN